MASGRIINSLKSLEGTGTTNANGDITINVLYQRFISGISTTRAANAQFRISGGGDTVVAHFTDNNNQNITNTPVTCRVYYT